MRYQTDRSSGGKSKLEDTVCGWGGSPNHPNIIISNGFRAGTTSPSKVG